MAEHLPPIHILASTWAPDNEIGRSRAKSARTAIRSWRKNLSYQGELVLHVADDGSALAGFPDDLRPIWVWEKPRPMIYSSGARLGVGASLNRGIERANFHGALLFYPCDDWELTAPLDLTPWARLLLRDESIGAVRIGIPHPWLTGTIEFPGEGVDYLMRLDRHHYVASLRPTLFHRRFFDAYGLFDEGVSSYEVERLYNERYCSYQGPRGFMAGPDVVLGILHPWNHVGEAEVGDITPGMGL